VILLHNNDPSILAFHCLNFSDFVQGKHSHPSFRVYTGHLKIMYSYQQQKCSPWILLFHANIRESFMAKGLFCVYFVVPSLSSCRRRDNKKYSVSFCHSRATRR